MLISIHNTAEFLNTSLGRPYWQTSEMRGAAVAYFAFAILAIFVWLSVWRSIVHFRRVTREARAGNQPNRSFDDRAVAPEFTVVARDFDRLVHDLRGVAQDIRQAAEDNAHSLKAPIGVITSALEPIRRATGNADARARKAIDLIDSSLSRLRSLVNSAQHFDNARADMIEAPSVRVDLAAVVNDVLARQSQAIGNRGIRIVRDLERNVSIFAAKEAVELIVENIVDNAFSFSPTGGRIAITLVKDAGEVRLRVEDEGPGVDRNELPRIFERHFSTRRHKALDATAVNGPQSPGHAGLGLWIVRRNAEALGGTVRAFNRGPRGFAVEISLRPDG